MTGELERGNGLPVGLERGNVLGLEPNVLAGLVACHEVSNGIQYSYASPPKMAFVFDLFSWISPL